MCLFMLLGSPASGESATDDRLAPQDTVEIGVSGWHTLLGGVAEATLLNDTFTIGRGGTLELPGIGPLPAAGLSESELAKLIADRLQVRSGSHQRPVTTVQRRTRATDVPPLRATARVTGAPAAARPRVTEPTAQPQTLGSERSRGEELQEARREALAARQAARDATIRHYRRLVEERRRAVTLAQELHAARAHIEAMKVQLQQQAKAARDRESAVTEANEAERTKRAALEEKLLAARKEIDATKNGALSRQRDATLRDDLAATRSDLEAMRRAADEAGAQARKVAAMAADQERALENERRRAEGLARDRAMMLREIERLQSKTAGAIRSKAAALRARDAAEASLINARRVLDDERRKLAAQERELAFLRQSALQVRAELQAVKQAAEVAARERAERTALEEKLLAARKEIEAIKNGALLASRQREASLRHDLAEARSDLEAMRRAADEAGSQARKLAVLTAGEARSKAAALRARNAAGALLSDARRALEDGRRKLAAQERDLALLRQSALQTRAELQAAKQAALQAGRLAEATTSRAGEALDLERERGRSLARDLESAREERDVARKQLALSVAALGKALGDEPDRSNSRELAVEGKEVKLPKREAQRPMASIEHRRKAGVGDRASARATPVARKRGGSVEVRKVELGKPTRSVQSVTLALPEELLPTRSPVRGR
ncbi:polysaccharide biosynthesis/export family protein [Sinorhizobium americanum]|uniref:polysaccharide biosynthesis/export family protein n=1 Tax=Sinorhizobium americanum TaxID=194963 RepID=UPI001F432E49|nr:polysaccharide biosynthesis/export family protein [Sinorhizobium americanum]